jgi:transcriptional regulator with XRE-family HTH domain
MQDILYDIKKITKMNDNEIAKKIGCSVSMLSLVKCGKRHLNISKINELLKLIEDEDLRKEIVGVWVDSCDTIDLSELNLDVNDREAIKKIIIEKLIK